MEGAADCGVEAGVAAEDLRSGWSRRLLAEKQGLLLPQEALLRS